MSLYDVTFCNNRTHFIDINNQSPLQTCNCHVCQEHIFFSNMASTESCTSHV